MKRLNFIAAAGIMALGAVFACSPAPDDNPPGLVKGGKGGKGGAGGNEVKGGSGGKMVTEPMAGKGGAPEGGAGGKGGEGGSGGGQAGVGGANLIGLIGQWRFDEGQGTEAKDSSGSGNDGTVVAGAIESAPVAEAPKWTAGRSGKALELNGTTQWIRVPSSESMNTTGTNGAVTMAAWVKANKFDETGDDFNFVMSRHEIGSAFDHFGLGLLSGRPAMSIHFFPAVGASVISVDDKWHHIVGTYDGITMSVYLDGESVAATDIGFSIAGDTTNLVIGGNQNIDVVKELWGGALDNVSLYNRALSLSEVKNLFDAAP